MKVKEAFGYAVYFILFLFYFYLGRAVSVPGFAAALYAALVYNRKNQLFLAPLYIAAAVVVSPTLNALILNAPLVLIIAAAYFICYKFRVKMRIVILNLCLLIGFIPAVFVSMTDTASVIRDIVGLVTSEALVYVFVAVVYAALVRKLRFKPTAGELFSAGVALTTLGLGTVVINIGWFSLFFVISVFLILLSRQFNAYTPLFVAAALGAGTLGAWETGVTLAPFATVMIFGLSAACVKREFAFLGGIIGIAAQALLIISGLIPLPWFSLVAPAAATLTAALIPKKFRDRLHGIINCFTEARGARAVVNRDRQETAYKIGRLSAIMGDVSDILGEEAKRAPEATAFSVARETADKCCAACAAEESCRAAFGGDTASAIEPYAAAAMRAGRATILDTPPFISSRCRKINGLTATINNIVERMRTAEDRKSDISEGKSLLREQLRGISGMLGELRDGISRPLVYDTAAEKAVLDKLSAHSISATEAYLSGSDGARRLTLTVKEEEIKKKNFVPLVCEALGAKMMITRSESTINGTVTLNFEPAPRYGLAYGSRMSSAEGVSGDKESVIRLSERKAMLILIDAMGTGAGADRNGSYAMTLIENFYRAGFGHETTLGSLAKLLALRGKEEFSAIDLAVVDLSDGTIDFIKQGGRESFIVTEGEVEIIECGALPLGIVESPLPFTDTRRLTPSSFVVMISDGILDAVGREGMCELLAGLKSFNPDDAAAAVMENAERLGASEKDDASVLAARIYAV